MIRGHRLVDVETVAVLRQRWVAGTVSDRRFAAAVEDLEQLDLDRYPTLPTRCGWLTCWLHRLPSAEHSAL